MAEGSKDRAKREPTLLRGVWGERAPDFIHDLDRAVTTGLQFVGDLNIVARNRFPRLRGPQAPDGQAPVVLVHGYGVDVGSLAMMARLFKQDGFKVFNLELDTVRHPVEELGQQIARRIEEIREFTGCKRVDLIGHSLGGMVVRYYVQMCVGWKYVDHVVTLGTPHRDGTYAIYAIRPLRYFGLFPAPKREGSTEQLMPGSEFFRRINAPAYRVDNLKKVDFTAIWSAIDECVLPAWNGYLRPGKN
ncbi:MAG: alpha/beta fold hydrolase, partial [Candidatus Methylomirabilis sp.]|nr:alpha/beta fold hydrolase [Deltaproteobacteria bacterium]